MTAQHKNPENSVTNDIINKVHITLADLKTGEEILNFLKITEPVFMDEVNRFIKTEISRMRYNLTETQALYIGSVIGASYIAGFLIARESAHELFGGLLSLKSDIKQALSQAEVEKIIDKNLDEGKSYRQIATVIQKILLNDNKMMTPKKKSKAEGNSERGKRLDIGDLE